MKKGFVVAALLFVAGGYTWIACNSGQSEIKSVPETEYAFSPELAKRGEYLVSTMVCDDCHTPKKMGPNGPEPDLDRRLAGHMGGTDLPYADSLTLKNWMLFSPDLTAIKGPWGTSFAANLTSDETGTGNWTFENFKTAIRKGKYKGQENGRDLLPPMPWQQYRFLTDDDLKAIFAYLKTTKPIENVVPAPIPPGE